MHALADFDCSMGWDNSKYAKSLFTIF
jgi:hypothetical protein